MRLTTTSLMAMVSGLIVLGLPAIYFLTGHQIITGPPQVSETAGQRSAPVDQSVNAIGEPAASDSVTAPAPTTSDVQPTPAGPANSPVTEMASTIPPCNKPDGFGLSRIVQIDSTGGPEFGSQHLKGHEFLLDKDVVLTFDDGPWPSTEAVLKALTDECLKATFFEIGQHASWHPAITKQVIHAGMTVGTHTWSHKDLARNPYANDPKKAEWEIEMGNSAVYSAAAGGNIAPFFRFPDLQAPHPLPAYFAERNIAIFSTDIDSRDFAMHKPQQVIESVMSQLKKRGKGIVLLHDLHRNTAVALPELFRQLKVAGYKIVHMIPKEQLTTIPKYDDMFNHRETLSSSAQPGHVAAPANVAATHQRRGMYMYVPAQAAQNRTPKTGASGGY